MEEEDGYNKKYALCTYKNSGHCERSLKLHLQTNGPANKPKVKIPDMRYANAIKKAKSILYILWCFHRCECECGKLMGPAPDGCECECHRVNKDVEILSQIRSKKDIIHSHSHTTCCIPRVRNLSFRNVTYS